MAFSLSGLTSMFANQGAQAIGAGLLSGVVGGTALVTTGVIPVGASSEPAGTIELLACPDTGPALARINDGARLLVTGRSADGEWLEVYIGQPGIDRAWMPATSLDLQESGDGLPVVDCAAPTPGPLPTLAPPPTPTPTPSSSPTSSPSPSPSVTAIATATATLPPGATPTPTPRATASKTPTPSSKTPTPPPASPSPSPAPTPTPTPTPTPPDLTAPSISNIQISGGYHDGSGNWYIDNAGNACGTPTSATVSATITDAGGSGLNLQSVRLRFWATNGVMYDIQMGWQIGTSTFRATVNNNVAWPAGEIVYWITASDNSGNTTTTSAPPVGAPRLHKGLCLL